MDWAVWENAYWYQDFPIKTISHADSQDDKQQLFDFNKDFVETLGSSLDAMLPRQQL